jgi:hypothetical protein
VIVDRREVSTTTPDETNDGRPALSRSNLLGEDLTHDAQPTQPTYNRTPVSVPLALPLFPDRSVGYSCVADVVTIHVGLPFAASMATVIHPCNSPIVAAQAGVDRRLLAARIVLKHAYAASQERLEAEGERQHERGERQQKRGER